MMSARPEDFAPPLLRIQKSPPAPLAGVMLKVLLALLTGMLLWALFGKLDIVAVAEGKLVPESYVKILQPFEQGMVKDILVKEGELVKEGQVLARMDAVMTGADVKSLANEYHTKHLGLRRAEAQLNGLPLKREPNDPPALYAQAESQYQANVASWQNALAQERAVLDKAHHDLSSAEEVRNKLTQTLPHYKEQEAAYAKLEKDGFAGRLMYTDKQRERIEKEQDLRTQEFTIRAAKSTIEQSERKLTQITADYKRQLHTDRIESGSQMEKAKQELAKHEHRQDLLELRAPQAGYVKDLATHTPGTVVSPGTILMTLVPKDEILRAEVWVGNQDVGFVDQKQPVKLKIAAFPFQKYGMVEGNVLQISADATEAPTPNTRTSALAGREQPTGALAFRALVDLKTQHLESDNRRYPLAPGMQVVAEINLGQRTVMEYILSPVQKAWHEAGRER